MKNSFEVLEFALKERIKRSAVPMLAISFRGES